MHLFYPSSFAANLQTVMDVTSVILISGHIKKVGGGGGGGHVPTTDPSTYEMVSRHENQA